MEDSPSVPASTESWTEQFAQAVTRQRARLREFATSQGERFGNAQAELLARIERLIGELERNRVAAVHTQAEAEGHAQQAAAEHEAVERLREQLAAQQAEWDELQRRAGERYAALAENVETQVRQIGEREAELERRKTELDAAWEQRKIELDAALERRKAEFEAAWEQRKTEQEAALGKRKAELDAAEAELRRQRTEIRETGTLEAGELREQAVERERRVASLQEELEAAEKRRLEFASQLAETQTHVAEKNVQLEAAVKRHAEIAAEVAELRRTNVERDLEWDSLRKTIGRLETDLEASRRQAEQSAADVASRERASGDTERALRDAEARWNEERAELEERCRDLERAATFSAAASAATGEAAAELESLRVECERLQTALAENEARTAGLVRHVSQLEEQLESGASGGGGVSDTSDDLHRRYELALDDLREVKARNEALEAQLREVRASGAQPASRGGGLDWEAEKRRILAALDAEEDESAEFRVKRTEISDVIQTTEKVVHEQATEIAELKKLLADQSHSLGSVAVGAAALGEIFDKDEIILEERESLKRLQEEWEAKLRKAEVEISLERAKIARERAQLEERLRALEIASPRAAAGDTAEPAEKPARGRWLSRLGLREDGNA